MHVVDTSDVKLLNFFFIIILFTFLESQPE